jgi:hypothetical protein
MAFGDSCKGIKMYYTLQRPRKTKYSQEEIIQELKRVAEIYNYKRFSYREYDKVAKLCHSSYMKHAFGSWNKALDAIGIPLIKEDARKYSDIVLFNEMEKIWNKIGHRPSRSEWEQAQPKITYNTYRKHYGTWLKSCQKFIEFKMGEYIPIESKTTPNLESSISKTPFMKDKRDIPDGLRYKVLKRDNFKCVTCGSSPANNTGTILHVDHIIPFSKGGKTTIDNLQSLCQECNLGKSNRE